MHTVRYPNDFQDLGGHILSSRSIPRVHYAPSITLDHTSAQQLSGCAASFFISFLHQYGVFLPLVHLHCSFSWARGVINFFIILIHWF